MTENWKTNKLESVCAFQNGFAFKSKSFKESGTPIVRITNIQNGTIDTSNVVYIDRNDYKQDLTKYEVVKGDLLVAMSGATTGKVGILQTDKVLLLNQRVGLFKPKPTLDKKYLYYYLSTKIEESLAISAGSAQPNLSTEQIKNFLIPTPPIATQMIITSILDQAFKAIEKAKSNIEKNIENAKELFQSKLNNIFSQKGEGWEEKTLGEVSKYDKTKYIGNDRPYVGLENIESNSGMFLGNLDPFSVKSSTFQFDERHILYGRLRPYLNKVLVPSFKGHCSTEIFPILPTDEVNREYLFYWFLAPNTVSKIDATWTGARMPRANMNEVINFKLPIPSIDIQEEVSVNLSNLKASLEIIISQYEEQLLNIEDLKKSILQKAFAGELTNKTAAA